MRRDCLHPDASGSWVKTRIQGDSSGAKMPDKGSPRSGSYRSLLCRTVESLGCLIGRQRFSLVRQEFEPLAK